MTYTADQLAQWRLVRTKGIGPVAFKRLLTLCGSAEEAVYRLPQLSAAKGRPTQATPLAEVEQEATALTKIGGTALFLNDPAYPNLLSHVSDPPPMLHVLGNPAHLTEQTLAIVGSRNASASGQKYTQQLGTDLAHAGYTLVSGLARGIDTVAHRTALQAETSTLAVVAGGVDHIYPPENKDLRAQIIAHGCVVSEQPLGAVPTARHFPRRNRIIAGLSRAVIVTEASRRSGTLITATYAGEYGREVFAVPGNPADPRAAGTNHLLKQGATLLESADDILAALDMFRPFTPQPAVAYTGEEVFQMTLTDLEAEDEETTNNQLENLLSHTPIALDELIRRSPQSETEIIIELTELELLGRLKRHPNGDVSLT